MPIGDVLPPEIERIATEVVDSAFKVYRHYGPGLLEHVYEVSLAHELRKRGFKVDRQVPVPIVYDGIVIEAALKLDLLVDDAVIVELKAVEQMIPLYDAQVQTYLKLTGKRLAFLINFNVDVFREGVKRIIH